MNNDDSACSEEDSGAFLLTLRIPAIAVSVMLGGIAMASRRKSSSAATG
jgi:hypothetical protein